MNELTLEEYKQRAEPRLKRIERLAKRIDFSDFSWKYTWEGEQYERLIREQGEDEQRAGL